MNQMKGDAKSVTRVLLGILGTLMIVICIAGAFLLYEYGAYDRRRQEKQLTRMLEQDPRVEAIEFESFLDGPGLYKIETVTFSIKGKPGGRITFWYPDSDESTFDLCQIGNLHPLIAHSRDDSSLRFPLIAGTGKDRIDTGVEINTLSDLVTHYDEVYEYFREWPTNPRSTEVHTVEGRAIYGSLREWSVRE
jgi:hypothetical protein